MGIRQQYPVTGLLGATTISTANTLRDGSGTLGDLISAGAHGSLVSGIRVMATGTTTEGAIRLFHHDGTTTRLLKELPVMAVTPSATVPAWAGEIDLRDAHGDPFPLPINHSLKVATERGETFNVFASGAHF